MNRLASVLPILLVVSAVAYSEQLPAVGTKFKKKWRLGNDPAVCMTQPAQLDPCVERVFDGIKYQIAYSEKTHRVSYLYTADEKFRTADGLKIGDAIPVTRDNVRALPGWQIYAPTTRDGWRPIIGYDLLQIKLKDGTVLDLASKEEQIKTAAAVILGFSKGLP
jgi:hypothetical protein